MYRERGRDCAPTGACVRVFWWSPHFNIYAVGFVLFWLQYMYVHVHYTPSLGLIAATPLDLRRYATTTSGCAALSEKA